MQELEARLYLNLNKVLLFILFLILDWRKGKARTLFKSVTEKCGVEGCLEAELFFKVTKISKNP